MFTWLQPGHGRAIGRTGARCRPRAARSAGVRALRPPGVRMRPAIPSRAPSAAATGLSRCGSCHARPARAPRAWTAIPRSAWEVRNALPTAGTGRRRGWPARRACRDAPTPRHEEPARVSRPPERHRHLSACSAASRSAALSWPNCPAERTAVSPGGPTSTTWSCSTSTVRHRSRLMTSPQLTRHTRRPSTEPCNSLRWPRNEFSSADDEAGCGAVATDERTSSTVLGFPPCPNTYNQLH